MNLEQLAEVEAGLGISLPGTYRQCVLLIPKALAGNSSSKLWDDPRALIALNLELRRTHGWTARHFALGRDSAGSTGALDLDLGLILWADRCRLPKPGEDGYQPGSVVELIEQWLRDLSEPAHAKLESGPTALTYDAPPTVSSQLIVTVTAGVVLVAGFGILLKACL